MRKNLSITDAYRLATQNHKQKKIKIAFDIYNQILSKYPNHFGSIFNLGLIYQGHGNFEKAINCFEKIIKEDKKNENILFSLGVLYYKAGDNFNSLSYFEKLIKINPNFPNLKYNLTGILRLSEIRNFKTRNNNMLKSIISFLFKNNDIDHTAISKNAISILLDEEKIKHTIKSGNLLLQNEIINTIVTEELFHLILQKSLITENYLEKLLTNIRYELLIKINSDLKDSLNLDINFIISLAEQCWLNEYIWPQSVKENNVIKLLKIKIEQSKEIDELEIAILASCMSLNDSKIIINKLLNYVSDNELFNDLINLQIKEPRIEHELKKDIKSIDEIKNLISKKVRNQYEKNPYPRWRYFNNLSEVNFVDDLNKQIKPNMIDNKDISDHPIILLAGCGTGKHILSLKKYKNAKIVAVDLSLSSIAYAKRKTEELGIKNIDYLHADILNLNNLDKRFDIIESVGTLHHMEDPIKGLKILINLLKPNGLMRLGLYSDHARANIVSLRNFIDKSNLKNTNEDIKACREMIINNKTNTPITDIILNRDFYSMSNVRDLLFHTQEHRYTVPDIIKILESQNLQFLGFVFSNQLIKKRYSKIFPNDKLQTNLRSWNEFEMKYPDTFISMYQFWVKKIN